MSFVLPDLNGLAASELDGLLAAVRDEAATLNSALSDASTADGVDIERLSELADMVDQLNAAKDVYAAKVQERNEKAAALAARINPAPAAVEGDEADLAAKKKVPAKGKPGFPGAAPEFEAEDAVEGEADLAAAPGAPAPANDADNPTPPMKGKKNNKGMAMADAVVAGAGASAVANPAAVVALAPKAKLPADTREVAIVAAAGLPGIQGGTKVDMDALVEPAMDRWNSYPQMNEDGSWPAGVHAYAKDQLFTLKRPALDPRLVANRSNLTNVLEYASDSTRLAHKSPLAAKAPLATGIVAAGGWCAPAEQRFDVCTLASLDGILDVPTIAMPRGSISYFRELDYSTVTAALTAGEFCFTNAQLVATPPVVKPCFEIPCATPVTGTLDVCGLCLRAGLLQQKAFPELIAAWMHLSLIAFAHFLNQRNINQMIAGSAALVTETATFGAVSPFLDSIYLRATQYRLNNGMAMDAPLEMVGPYWVPEVLAVDILRRQFNSDENFNWQADIANHNIRAQWVKDYQDAAFLTAAAGNAWPAQIQYLLFAPGAWVRGSEDIISVSTLVDSTLLQTNRVQLLFIETATIMLPWCGPSVQYAVPICPSGETNGPITKAAGTGVGGTYACSGGGAADDA